MAAKTEFSKDELVAILSNYNLGEYKDAQSLAIGTVQTNFLLQTTKGKFVFRYYENRSKDSVLFESDLIKYLRGKNYPCPMPISNNRGRSVGLYNQKSYIIFEFMEGQHVENPTKEQNRQLIQRVAELHNLTRNYRPVKKNSRWNYSVELCRALAQKESKKINTINSGEK